MSKDKSQDCEVVISQPGNDPVPGPSVQTAGYVIAPGQAVVTARGRVYPTTDDDPDWDDMEELQLTGQLGHPDKMFWDQTVGKAPDPGNYFILVEARTQYLPCRTKKAIVVQ